MRPARATWDPHLDRITSKSGKHLLNIHGNVLNIVAKVNGVQHSQYTFKIHQIKPCRLGQVLANNIVYN